MYLLNEFKRKLGSKDKQKRKSRLKLLRTLATTGLVTAGVLIGGTKLINASGNLAANSKKFKNLFLKKTTKNLNNEVKEQIKKDRNAIKTLINNQPKPKSTDVVLGGKDLRGLYKQQEADNLLKINNLKQQQKIARRNTYGTRYETLNQQKTGLARIAGRNIASAGLSLGLGGGLVATMRYGANKAKKKKDVPTN